MVVNGDNIKWKDMCDTDVATFILLSIRYNINLFYPEQLKVIDNIVSKIKNDEHILSKIGEKFRCNMHENCTTTYEHNKNIEIFDPMFVYLDKQVVLSDHEKAYISHFVHANANNIILLILIYMSFEHSLKPQKFQFDSLEILIKLYFLSRSHISSDIFESSIVNVLTQFDQNHKLDGWKENFIKGFHVELRLISNRLGNIFRKIVYRK